MVLAEEGGEKGLVEPSAMKETWSWVEAMAMQEIWCWTIETWCWTMKETWCWMMKGDLELS